MTQTKYKPQMVTSKICYTSRASVNVGDAWYTVEAQEERVLPEVLESDFDIEKERAALWDEVNSSCDAQIEDILRSVK